MKSTHKPHLFAGPDQELGGSLSRRQHAIAADRMTTNLAHRTSVLQRTGSDSGSKEPGLPQTYILSGSPSNTKLLSPVLSAWVQAGLIFTGLLLLTTLYQVDLSRSQALPTQRGNTRNLLASPAPVFGPTLVSYSYFEKDDVQRFNMEFFMAVGMGQSPRFKPPQATDFVVIISGEKCSPCKQLLPSLVETHSGTRNFPEISQAWSVPGLTMLQRTQNEGMDFAAHNITLQWLQRTGSYGKYRYFIFLNSSVRGPFYPSYMPQGWQWTRAYTDRIVGNVKLVSSSIVCLPTVDAGGFGPKAESWAFATDPEALELFTRAGVFHLRTCKLCDDGVVVRGEYGLTNVLFSHGLGIATLMSMYHPETDWLDDKNWHCNNNAHPSRHGSYDGIAMHPFEVVFLKASWHVGEPHTAHYSKWFLAQAQGSDNTAGAFDEPMYRYAISMEAQEPNNAESCFKVV